MKNSAGRSVDKVYNLNIPQDKFVFSTNHFCCIKGTWGCGKSLAGLLSAHLECQNHPENLFIVIRKEFIDLENSTMRDWKDWIGLPITGREVKYPNGSTLIFLHGDDLDQIKNINAGGALMVQAEEMTEDDFWFLNGRLRRQQGTRQLRLECNYDGKNWIYKLFNQQKVGDLITTNTFDNSKHLPPDYIENLKKLPQRLQDRHLYGSDADTEGAVYDQYRESEHVVQPFVIPKDWMRLVSLDHGVTNPTAVLWAAVDYDDNVFIYDEHYEAGQVISYHAEEIKKRDNSGVQDWLIDPSCNAKINSKNGHLFSVVDEYQEAGLFFRSANNEVLGGINRVNEYFKANRIKIFRSCFNLIDEICSYKWQRVKAGQTKNEPDKPIKFHDHACDALRYLIMSRPEKPIRQMVRTFDQQMASEGDPFVELKKEEVFAGGVED